MILPRLVLVSVASLILSASASAAERDPQMYLKDAGRLLRASDTPSALLNLRQCILDPLSKDWMIDEAVKMFAANFRAASDSSAARGIFSLALRSPRAVTVVPSVLSILVDYGGLTSEEKLSLLTGVQPGGKATEEVLAVQIQLLRRLGRLDPALELSAKLVQSSSRLEHRALMLDLLLDLSRTVDAVALANAILNDHAADPAAFSLLSERFYRHGDYRNTLDIHRRARGAFSNPMLFFDQSLSICQGLQLGREGVELYLPVLLDASGPAPEYYRDFLSMVTDTSFFTRVYPSWIAAGSNPNLYLAALSRFADLAPENDCLEFARVYRNRFHDASAHLALAEQLLERDRRPAFLNTLADLPDTPVGVTESKKLLLFKNALRAEGPDRALEQYPPQSFTSPAIRAGVHRLGSPIFFRQARLTNAIFSLKMAQTLAPEAQDDLGLAQMYFFAGADSEALEAAYRAHRLTPLEETLYWLGWLSFLRGDTETARKAFRDVILRSENFLADESLSWLIAMGRPADADPDEVGRAARQAAREGTEASEPVKKFPLAARLAIRREALRAGLRPKSLADDESPFLRFLLWESMPPAGRTAAQYQKLLRDAPEFLRPMIRVDEP